ncbi:MAG: HD domain-containing protein, partial [Methylovulum sp.]|nr:HD domain-containing protein [Methylovulum sp.]
MKLQWIAGQKSFYDDQGRYAFRTTQASKEFAAPNHGPYGELLYLTRCLAALLHDIGKATQAFQGKLYGAYCYEEYRHDLVGFLMLQSRFAAAGLPSDTVFLEGLAKPDTLWADAGKLFELPTKNPNICHTQLADWLGQAPVFTLVSWLVLTHHRLPDGLRDMEVQATEKSQRSTHVNTLDINRNIAEKSASQRPAGGALPWQDDKWQRQVANIAKRVSALLEQYPDLAADLTAHAGDWILANVHYNRPLLIAADHLATIQRDKSENKRHSLTENQFNKLLTATAYANDHRKSNGYWGDTVPQHLRRVEKLTRKLKTLLANVGHFRTAPIPDLSPAISPIPEHSPYHWQQQLAQAAQQNLDNRPVFAAIMAE